MKKINYYIAMKSGYEAVTGYKCEVVYGDKHYDLGIRSRTEGNGRVTWRIDHLETGMLIRSGFASRKEAVGAINYELMDAIEKAMEDGRYEKQVLRLRDFKVSQMAG